MNAWRELFPSEDYRFHLALRKGSLRDFFAPRTGSDAVRAERHHWLAAEPQRYAATQPEGEGAVAEWSSCLRAWGWAQSAECRSLGAEVEPDFLLLVPDAAGEFRLRAGALVFPTSWALEEKMGLTLADIHGPVPGLNATLAPPLNQLLQRLRPDGSGYMRANWGLAATDALNLHPSRPRPTLTAEWPLERIWLRVERQILAALPASRSIVFGIRIELHALSDVLGDPEARAGFHRAMRTMPPALAAYKGLAAIRDRLVEISGH